MSKHWQIEEIKEHLEEFLAAAQKAEKSDIETSRNGYSLQKHAPKISYRRAGTSVSGLQRPSINLPCIS